MILEPILGPPLFISLTNELRSLDACCQSHID